jgi:hypothetical protein
VFRELAMPEKKKAADVGKIVEAQAKGRKVKGARTDKPGAASELDVRQSKMWKWRKMVGD